MNCNLLSQNLILLICTIFSAIAVFLMMQLFRKNPYKNKKTAEKDKLLRKRLLIASAVALACIFIVGLILKLLFGYFTESQLPYSFILMVLPLTFSVALLSLIFIYKIKLWRAASILIIIGVFFSLLLINDYYRFYPTIGQLFNQNSNVANIGRDKDGIFVKLSSNLESNGIKNSLESELNSIGNISTDGKVYSLNIPGSISKFKARGAFVYVPAAYFSLNNTNFPVVVLTAGYPGLTENWLGSGLENTMDQFAHLHDGITPLVFMVDNTGSLTNDTECVNSARGNVEAYLATDVPNYIKDHFRVDNNPNNWAIGGLSMGGMCSVMLALRHTNIYHNFMDYGGEIGPEIGSKQKTIDTLFGGSIESWEEHQPDYLLTTKNFKSLGMGGFFGDGNQDSRIVTQALIKLSNDSQNAGIDTVSETINGPHTFNVWSQLFKDSLPWVSNRVGATQCNSECI